MMRSIGKAPAGRRRGAAQLVLVMLVILVIGVVATSAVRRSISVRRAHLHRDQSLLLERMLHAAQQWTQSGGDVGQTPVTLRLPSRRENEQATVVLRRASESSIQMTAALIRNGRSIATRSRAVDDGS